MSLDFIMVSGDSKVLNITVTDSADAAVDLSDVNAAEWSLYLSSALVTKTLGSGITVTDAVNGIVQVTIDPADTEELKGGEYKHGIQLTTSTGQVLTPRSGTTLEVGKVTIVTDFI